MVGPLVDDRLICVVGATRIWSKVLDSHGESGLSTPRVNQPFSCKEPPSRQILRAAPPGHDARG